VRLAVTGDFLWAVSNSGLSAFDTRRQRRVVVVARTPYPYTTRLAVSGRSVWVASIANGYSSGAVSRIDARTQRATTMLRLPHQPVWDICAGGGLVWALYGQGNNTRLARFGPTAHPHLRALHARASWCAADKSGVWITTAGGRLLHARPPLARLVGCTHLVHRCDHDRRLRRTAPARSPARRRLQDPARTLGRPAGRTCRGDRADAIAARGPRPGSPLVRRKRIGRDQDEYRVHRCVYGGSKTPDLQAASIPAGGTLRISGCAG